ncbi:ADP-ribose pyrophosphatase YjhB (NUDIX family) [Litorimonas taeanensis]|uniref:ADP-ribose pyrophosphatase YjhB (NUDIX family) n=1 Tax=Litorimonas taeanensis TaxID=568099 RepID=A0A420WJP7_9PROT|nr:CoA pyrophosphatase [Litorimonas taeanensis]RKQ71228.1 ADP-ribose pyrophosphatase YjhB (NUDIX family) [Litorimonas taeanensis]
MASFLLWAQLEFMRLNREIGLDWQSASKETVLSRLSDVLLPLAITDGSENVKREGQRVAAVLGLLVKRPTGWHMVLTQRPETMPSHPGQISFPGGKREKGESVETTALRETHEEIGVKPENVTLVGRLPSFDAVSSYRITPFFGVLDPQADMTANPDEVEDIFEVPLDFFMNSHNHKPREVFFDGRDHKLIDMPYDDPQGVHRNVWGMTAMMIYRLYLRLYAVSTTL